LCLSNNGVAAALTVCNFSENAETILCNSDNVPFLSFTAPDLDYKISRSVLDEARG